MNEYNKIKIDKGFPAPRMKVMTGLKLVLSRMEVDDSFEMEDITAARGNIYSLAKQLKMKVTIRSMQEKKIRIWRIQ